MSEFAFEARNISRSFGVVQALRGVSLGIRPGEVHAIIGENGAGKSTLMNIFCGKLQPSSGTLARNGCNSAIGNVFEDKKPGVSTSAKRETTVIVTGDVIQVSIRYEAA